MAPCPSKTCIPVGTPLEADDLCPLVYSPFPECFCAKSSSVAVEGAVYYCGGCFEECEIYRETVCLPSR